MKNILFISADQLRYDAMGFQNVFPVQTPNIDALAAGGTVFDNAYCTNPLCVPSRASIMTGRYSYQHGVYYNDQGWSDDLDTVAGNLAANGYYTAEFGKTHFMPQRKHYGFHKVINEINYKHYLDSMGVKLKRPAKMETWPDQVKWAYRTEPGEIPLEHYEPVYHTNNAVNELNHLVKTRQCTGQCHEPFFLWVSFLRPHTPCTPPEPYFSMYNPDDLPPAIRRPGEVAQFPKAMKKYHSQWTSVDDERLRKFRAQYLADVTIVDQQVGRLMGTLKQLGLDDNTMIIFFSDHGDMLGDHQVHQKGFFFEQSVRVPLIINGPEVPAQKRTSANVTLADLLPTAMDYAGLYQPEQYDADDQPLYHHQPPRWSRSLLKTVAHENTPEIQDRCVIAETGIHGQGIMVKQGSKKYCLYTHTDELQSFDLTQDPDEFAPVAQSFDELPATVQAAFNTVTTHTKEIAKKSYNFNNKTRPMFT